RFIQAKLQRHRRDAIEKPMSRFPHLAETAAAQQFHQFPVADAGRTIARLEARQTRWEKHEQIFGALQRQKEWHTQAGGIARSAQRLADARRNLREIDG